MLERTPHHSGATLNYKELLKVYPRYLGFGFLHTFFSSIGQTFLIALFIPSLREAFSQTATAMGSYYGMLTMMSAGLLFFTGPLIDRVNLRLYSASVGLTVATGCFLLVFAPSFWLALVGLFLVRHGGQALMGHTAFTSMTRYFTLMRGKALGITGLGIACGEAILPVTIALSITHLGWRTSYILLALSCLLLFLPLSLFLVNRNDDIQYPDASQDKDTPQEASTEELNWGRKQLLLHPYFWLILPLTLMPPFLGTGYFFFQKEIAKAKGWSATLFASCFLAYGLSAAMTSFLSGPWVDRLGAKRMLPFTLFPMMLGVWALIGIDSILGGYLFMFFLGVSFGSTGNARNAMWAEVYGRKHLGSIKSFASMVMVFSTALAPPLGGWLLDKGYSMSSILWGTIALTAGATLLAFFAKTPTFPKTPQHL
ncbi:MAG: hypothetical protein CL920_20990 [Deltaproteobacteria bacterium]|mgnify:CR=1 FL=1|nr:hypothetical protein [Deltaproteobacteria bacterium]|tara:strand:+ start:6380 stop:7657 length:1278 start_codon:yes stop_codon:yes gene_type:complete